MELINRQDAIKVLRDTFLGDTYEIDVVACGMIESLPTVDAEPVRHGRWIRDDFGAKCDACGLYAYRDKFDQPWESPYCPNCGAKMDGEQEKQEKEKAFWSRYLLKPCAEEEEEQNDQTD